MKDISLVHLTAYEKANGVHTKNYYNTQYLRKEEERSFCTVVSLKPLLPRFYVPAVERLDV